MLIVDNNKVQKPEINKPMLLSAWGKNSWSYSDYFKTEDTEQDFSFELVEYIPWAERKLVEDENGVEHLFFVESSEGSRHEHWIKKEQFKTFTEYWLVSMQKVIIHL